MSIEVHVRLRPQDPTTVAWSTAETVLYNVAQPETRYVFHKVHPLQNTTNHSIFRGVEPIVLTAFENHQHVSLLAYGPTGSGKTHSMSGTSDDHGIIQRTTRLLVKLASTHPGTTLGVSFLEVYNECVRDLLDLTRGNGDLALQDAPDGAVRVDKKVVPVESVGQFTALEKMAEQHRCYGVTDLNAHSSRSHVIITFEVRRRRRSPVDESAKAAEHDEKEEEEGGGRESRNAYITHLVHLVDLAGAECAGKARTEGQSLREGGFINKSLLALGNVVDALVERRPHIPYRDAKLTRLLRSALGGTGYTFILCCMHPGKENVEQTASALRFAQRAMRLKRDPVVVLPIPPLFTHQYAIAATSLLQSASYCADLAYQRGLKDAFFYCDPTMSSVAQHLQSEVGDSLRALAGMQRLLLAHEHATALEVVGEWYHKRDAAKEVYDEAVVKRRAAQDQLERLQEESRVRVEAVQAEELALTTLRNDTDTTLAEWEYKLKDVQRQRMTAVQLLLKKEEEDRRRLEYEFLVCVERIVYDCLHHDQLLHSLFQGGDVKGRHHHPSPQASTEENRHASSSSSASSPFPPAPLLPLPGDWRENGTWKAQWAEKIQHERRAVLELEAARGLLQERGAVSSAYGSRSTSEGGTAWRGNEKEEEEEDHDDGDENDAVRKEGDAKNERGTTTSPSSHGVQGLLALDAQLEALGMEEQRLRRMLLFNTHRYSLRRIRSSTSEASLSSLSNSPSQHRSAAPPPRWRKKRDEHDNEDGTTTGSREGWRKREGIRRHHFEQVDDEEDEEEEEAETMRCDPMRNERSQREGGGGEEGGGGGGRLRQTAPAVPIPSGGKSTTPPHPSTPPPLPSSSSSGVSPIHATTTLPTSSATTSPTEVLRAVPRASPAASRRTSSPTPLPLSHPLRAKERGGGATSSSTAAVVGHPLSPLSSASVSRPPLAGGYATASSSSTAAGWMRRAGESPSPSRSASTTSHTIHVYPPHSHRSRSRSETGGGEGGGGGGSRSGSVTRGHSSRRQVSGEDGEGSTRRHHLWAGEKRRPGWPSPTTGGGGEGSTGDDDRSGASHSREPIMGAKNTLQLIQELKQSMQHHTASSSSSASYSPSSPFVSSSTTTMVSSSGYLSDGGWLRTPAHVYRRSASSHRSHSRPLAPPSPSSSSPTREASGEHRRGSGAHHSRPLRSDAYRSERRGEVRSTREDEKRGDDRPRGRSPFQETWREGSSSPYSDTLPMPLGRPVGGGGGHAASSSSTFSYPARPPSKPTTTTTSSYLSSSYDASKSSYRSVKRAGDENGVSSPLLPHHQNTISGHRSSSSSSSGGEKKHHHSPLPSGYYSSEREQKMWKRAE